MDTELFHELANIGTADILASLCEFRRYGSISSLALLSRLVRSWAVVPILLDCECGQDIVPPLLRVLLTKDDACLNWEGRVVVALVSMCDVDKYIQWLWVWPDEQLHLTLVLASLCD